MGMDPLRSAVDAGVNQATTDAYADVALHEVKNAGRLEPIGKSPWFFCPTSGPFAVQAINTGGANAATVQVLTTWDPTLVDAQCPVLVSGTNVPLTSAVLLQAALVGPAWVKVQIKATSAGNQTTVRIQVGQKRL